MKFLKTSVYILLLYSIVFSSSNSLRKDLLCIPSQTQIHGNPLVLTSQETGLKYQPLCLILYPILSHMPLLASLL